MDQFLIAPLTEGLRTGVDPWLIPDEAFARLNNAYVHKGKLRKRFGTTLIPVATPPSAGFHQLSSRLRINLGNTDGAGDIAGTVPGAKFEVGQMFSIGEELFTVYQTGTPANMLTNSSTATVFTFDTTSGAYDIQTSLATTACYWYPSDPVMGFAIYEIADINDEPTYAFDTQFAYYYTATGWLRLGTGLWSEGDSNFFWSENYRGTDSEDRVLFVTNNSATDNIKYWDGSTWTTMVPQYTTNAGDTIDGCRCIQAFKDRLLLFNTFESIQGGSSNIPFPNRVRFCQVGDPLFATSATAWYEPIATPGKGGYIDIPTKEAIISVRKLRDRLIVFCERSTWELVYTGNQIRPFVPQQINSELGVESTFSSVLFERSIVGVGNVGIHACNGSSVERIDEKIPDEVFKIHNGNNGIERVCGIRDDQEEMIYWTFPGLNSEPTYPNKVLAYNYCNRTWSFNDDSITAFGYIQNLNDVTWQMLDMTWDEWVEPWNSGEYQSETRRIICGNQHGFTFLVDAGVARNAESLQITNMVDGGVGDITVTVINHNLLLDDCVLIENAKGNWTVDTTDVSGDATGTAPGTEWFAGQQFSIGSTTFTIADGVGATAMTQSGPPATTATFDLATGEYVFVGATALTSVVWLQTGVRGIYQIQSVGSSSTFVINETGFGGTYTGGGTIARVSKIDVKTKQFNFYQQSGLNCMVPKVAFYVGNTASGQICVDFLSSSSERSLTEDGEVTGALLGTNILETSPYATVDYEQFQSKFWHVLYPQAEGETVQLRFYLSDAQMIDDEIALSDFELNAMSIYARKVHRY